MRERVNIYCCKGHKAINKYNYVHGKIHSKIKSDIIFNLKLIKHFNIKNSSLIEELKFVRLLKFVFRGSSIHDFTIRLTKKACAMKHSH